MNKREDGRLIDVGYYLPYCGHRVIEGVWQGIVQHNDGKVYFSSEYNLNQYVLPLEASEFVVPHEEDKSPHEEERNNDENCYKTNTVLL
jgi:hypothetical protein